ncbi:hypothetical protein NS365_21590 [Aureimonas ureilytica]|uniref:Pyridoxal phosphate homeostasis protein n=1 Tax=Aureimonas ureilytica TaxID=401562 RepID=A0A175RFU1_9HYPH|nr:YggS family pyridoxal phosphate-dependent enzyme [Aureimonas ureilytica]KTR02525.1 hypothetical protein NS365_21590 [Aureimonas ureilytica]
MHILQSGHDVTADLKTNLETVRSLIADATKTSGRRNDAVTLIAASKTVDVDRLRLAIGMGQRVYGENRVQEAKSKWPILKEQFHGIELHLLGPLQSNKVRDAVRIFDVVQSVDRPSIARAIAAECDRQGRRPLIYVQVNTGEEAQKAGAMPADVAALVRVCRDECALDLTGLMCIPPANLDPCADFVRLADMARDEGLPMLSMGMSGDFVQAIMYGATHVRVGSAIFGSRIRSQP